MNEAKIYKALGDPIRLKMVKRLANGSPTTIGDLSKNLGLTRQGARKQLQVLVSAKVVYLVQNGRETQVSLDKASLLKAKEFINKIEQQWDQRLEALKAFVEDN